VHCSIYLTKSIQTRTEPRPGTDWSLCFECTLVSSPYSCRWSGWAGLCPQLRIEWLQKFHVVAESPLVIFTALRRSYTSTRSNIYGRHCMYSSSLFSEPRMLACFYPSRPLALHASLRPTYSSIPPLTHSVASQIQHVREPPGDPCAPPLLLLPSSLPDHHSTNPSAALPPVPNPA
jgi:hypothetical protein